MYEKDELLNKSVESIFINGIYEAIFEQVKISGKVHNYETELKRKNDEIICVSINANYLYDENSSPIGIQGIIRDITEKTKRNKELAQSYNELLNIEKINKAANEDGSAASIYLTLLNALNDTIGITSSQVYTFNKEKNKLFLIGETPEKGLLWLMEEKSKLKLREVTPVLSSQSNYRRVITEKKILITESSTEIIEILSDHFIEEKYKQTSSILKDTIGIKTFGMLPIVAKESVLSLITFNSTRYLSESEKKSIIRFVQQASVVLDKMNVQKYLSQNEERYRVFFEKNQGLLCTHDLDGKILTVNNAAAKSLNYTIEELMTMNIKNLLHPSLKGEFENYIKEIIQKKSKTGQFILVSKDSETKNWYYSNYLYDESDKKYVIGTAQDITDKLKIKEEKLRSEILKRESEEVKKLASQLELYSKKLENSIDYAKRLKEGMHINIPTFQKIFTDSFVIDFPRDIIGGDFYWLNIKNNKIVIALADCTGHGVPGALLAAMGCTMLNNIFLTETDITPIKLFEKLNFNWRNAFIFNRAQQHSYDGMEISLCYIDYKNKIIDFCGIGGEIFIYGEDKLTSYKGNSFEINQRYSYHYNKSEIISHKISYSSGDRIYLFSDGYCDQFGEKNKHEKLSKKRFKKLIEEIQHYDMGKQRNVLVEYFEKWKGNTSQIDDVMILGIQL